MAAFTAGGIYRSQRTAEGRPHNEPTVRGTRCAHTRQRVRAAPVRGGRERRVTASGMWGQEQPGAVRGLTGKGRKASSEARLGCPGPIPHPALSGSAGGPKHGAAIRHGRVTAAAAHAAARLLLSPQNPPLWAGGGGTTGLHVSQCHSYRLIHVLRGGSH